MAKLIAVFGATGTQGGGVVRALLDDQTYRVRAITRNPRSAKARAMAKQGVEVVQGNYEDVSTLEAAMAGCYGVFAVTDYWEYTDKAKESQVGFNLVDVAVKAGVTHFVYSGLQNVSALLGKSCGHFDGKAEVEDRLLLSASSAAIRYRTVVRFAEYMEMLLTEFPPTKLADNLYSWDMPMEGKPVDMLHAGCAGPAILSIFKSPENYHGRAIGLSGDRKTIPEYCEIINKYIAPVKIQAGGLTTEEFGRQNFPMAQELAVMFDFYQSDHTSYSVLETRQLDPGTHDFEDFIRLHRDQLIAMLK